MVHITDKEYKTMKELLDSNEKTIYKQDEIINKQTQIIQQQNDLIHKQYVALSLCKDMLLEE